LRFLASITKEVLLLLRDKAGLAILLIMPVSLAVIVTLIQDSTISTNQFFCMELLLVNHGESEYAEKLEDGLLATRRFEIIKQLEGNELTEATARAAVDRGDYQVCVIIPAGIFEQARDAAGVRVAVMAQDAYGEGEPDADSADSPSEIEAGDANISIRFDPVTWDIYQQFVISQFQRLTQAIEMTMITEAMVNMAGDYTETDEQAPQRLAWEPQDLVGVTLEDAAEDGVVLPNSVQQNIPAWTLFAMFMIAIPLAGSMIKERDYGTLQRIQAMPISRASLLSAKLTVYTLVCLLQFVIMLLLGLFVLPRCGTPTLELGSHPLALLVAALSSALAASGFGLLVGSIARTHDQASVFSATSVVIGAALGGLMVPSFLMPEAMRKIGQFLPLNWGLNAFLELFVRDGNLQSILSNVIALMAFFAGTTTLAILISMRRE
jgi:ABC-2 type transport system permease protein